jgi:hypothetical protein
MRAFYGITVCLVIGVTVSLATKPKSDEDLTGLVIDSLEKAKRLYKGGKAPHDHVPGKKVTGMISIAEVRGVRLSPAAMARLKAEEGDLLYVADARWWLGGLRSAHVTAGPSHDGDDRVVIVSQEDADYGNLHLGRPVSVVKIM